MDSIFMGDTCFLNLIKENYIKKKKEKKKRKRKESLMLGTWIVQLLQMHRAKSM